jgi:hypothetical protein
MNPGILIPYGLKNNSLVHISDVESGLKCGCVCPVCNDNLVARKGTKKRHYFAHHSGSTCNKESLLHYLGKKLLFDRIDYLLFHGEKLDLHWECDQCEDEHDGDLIKKACSVKLEASFGECRPDITLFDLYNKPIVFIEIIVTHEPEDQVYKFVKDNKIAIVEFLVDDMEDVESLATDKVLKPMANNICLRPKCECGKPLWNKNLHVLNVNCWKCKSKMKIAMIDVEFGLIYPDGFSEFDIKLSLQHGVIIKENYSRTDRRKYLSNTCGKCKSFIGNFFMHDFRYAMKTENIVYKAYYCGDCLKQYTRSIIIE